MGGLRASGQLCERAREWASLRLDGELSQLEQALLDAHLVRCAECRAYATESEALTLTLRMVDPEQPTAPIVLPRRASGALRNFQTGVAAAMVIAAAALGSALGVFERSMDAPEPGTLPAATSAATSEDESADALRKFRRPSLIHQRYALLPRNGPRVERDSI